MRGKRLNSDRGLAVVILAAGRGQRMKSTLPKVLHPLHGRPLLEHVVKTARSLRPDRIIIVVGYRAWEVRRRLSPEGSTFVLQKEQRGTAHAVMQTETELSDFEGDIIILSGDVPMIRPETVLRLLQVHRETGAALSFISTTLKEPSGYGRVIRSHAAHSAGMDVSAIREERDASEKEKKIREINSGIYCTSKQFLFKYLGRVDCNNEQKEYYLTDLVKIAGDVSLPVACYHFNNPREVLGINTLKDLEKAEKAFHLNGR